MRWTLVSASYTKRRREEKGRMKKVMFNEDTDEFYGDYGNGMIAISQDECYHFINSKGVKCLGGKNGYAVYGYR